MREQSQLPQGIQASLLNALDRHFMACAAVAAIATVAGQAEQADANIVYSGIQNVPLTNGSPGIYINLVSNAVSSSQISGWDINPYVNASGGTFFGMYMPGSLTTKLVKSSAPSAGAGDIGELPISTIIGPSSTFTAGIPATFAFFNNATAGDWVGTGSGYMGIEFIEAGVNGGAPMFGWVQISKTVTGEPSSSGSTGITFVDWAYDNTGSAIVAGATSLPEPSSLALLATGAIGLLARRGRVSLRPSNT